MAVLTWLHLTDLHQGMAGERWLWPNIREAFYQQLPRILEQIGALDPILFTGDLTQKGGVEEFISLNERPWRNSSSTSTG